MRARQNHIVPVRNWSVYGTRAKGSMDNVQNEFGPTMFLIRCAGISATSRNKYFNIFLKVYSVGWFMFLTVSAVVTFIYCRQLREGMWTPYELFRYRTTISIMYLNYLLLAGAAHRKSSSFRWVIQSLHRIDKNLMKNGLHSTFKAGYHVYLRILGVGGLGLIWLPMFEDYSTIKLIDWTMTICASLSSCASQCLFYSLMKMIADRIDFVSKKLEETFVHMPYDGGAAKITALIGAHNAIIKVAAHLEEICSFQLLVTSTASFTLMVSRIYYMCQGTHSASYFADGYTCANRFFELYTLVLATTRVLGREDDYQHNLYENLMDDENRLIIEDDKVKTFLLHNRELQFTACGFFKIDFAILATVCGAVFTFVIILLQLD